MLSFNPLYTTLRLESVLAIVREHYALVEPLRGSLLHRGLNDVYLIEASDGRRAIFRLSHRRARGPADVTTETDFLVHLVRSGAPVAEPIATREGALFVDAEAPEGRRQGVLFAALQGRAPEAGSSADASANGATLAKIHNAAETFRAEAPLYRLDLDHLLRRPLERILNSGVVEDAGVRADYEALAARAAEAIERMEALTWTHCHGDCHGFNARIGDSGEAAFFDFDDGGPGYLAYDLAVFLWAKVSFGRQLTAMWRAFVDGYRALRPISPQDYEAAHRFVIVRHIWLMGEYASRVQEWGRNNVEWIGRESKFLQAWEAEQLQSRLF